MIVKHETIGVNLMYESSLIVKVRSFCGTMSTYIHYLEDLDLFFKKINHF